MVNFDKFSSENTVIFDDFSPKITVVVVVVETC